MATQHIQTNGHVDEAKIVPVAVVMVPFPPQGHLNPLLHLSGLISAYGIPIHVASIPTAIHQAKAHVLGSLSNNIHFHELPIPIPNTNNNLPLSQIILPYFRAIMNLRDPVYDLARKLSTTATKIVVVYDVLLPYVVQDIRLIPNAESFCYESGPAFGSYAYFCPKNRNEKLPIEVEIALGHVPPLEESFSMETYEMGKIIEDAPKFHSGHIYNTSRAIEGQYVDLLDKQRKLKVWALGPFNSIKTINTHRTVEDECLKWLDEQEPKSVVFVSFGTTTSLPDEQVAELARGLERSGHKFIWVLRDYDHGEGSEKNIPLPDGYEESVIHARGQGLIVRDWAPQLEVLGHRSTGAFITHCGWNSVVESISNGIPMGTWPIQFDHPASAVLITEVLKIGTVVRDWSRRDQVLSSADVERAVRKLMSSDEGEEMRRRAEESRDAINGPDHKEMDSFIAHIMH